MERRTLKMRGLYQRGSRVREAIYLILRAYSRQETAVPNEVFWCDERECFDPKVVTSQQRTTAVRYVCEENSPRAPACYGSPRRIEKNTLRTPYRHSEKESERFNHFAVVHTFGRSRAVVAHRIRRSSAHFCKSAV